MAHHVYIMASRPGGAIYIGRTENLRQRLEVHRMGHSAHTAKYKIKTLVWFEPQPSFEASLARERSIKRWRRAWKKNQLIFDKNPHWQDMTYLIEG